MLGLGRCGECERELPASEFPRRQRKRLRDDKRALCSSCSPRARTAEDEVSHKKQEVAEFFHRESRGQVDGTDRKVKGGATSLAAPRPSQPDLAAAADIFGQFKLAYDVKTMSYDCCLAEQRRTSSPCTWQ